MLCLPTKCNIDWRWFYTGETRQSAPEASASSAAARVCVCAQMCVLCARVLMSPRLFDGKGEWGGEGRPALARPPAALCLLSLCILWWVHLSPPLSLSDSLCFLFILLSFMFSPFLYMIARSKAARGTGLQCWCEDFAVPEIQLNSDTQNKRSRAAAVPVPPPPQLIDREQCFGGLLPTNNLLNQCSHLFLHTGIMGTSENVCRAGSMSVWPHLLLWWSCVYRRHFKVALTSFCRRPSLTEFFFYAQTNRINELSPFPWLNKLNKQPGLKGQHNFLLLYFVYMWRTLPPF